MSLTKIKPYFRERLDSLNFKEFVDGLNTENLGEVDADRAYHIRPVEVGGNGINHTDQKTETEVEVKVFFKGGRNASEAVDDAVLAIEQIIKECCKVKNRTSNGLLNVVFERARIEPRATDNDNSVLVTFNFTTHVLLGVEE